jgi:HK97 family phage prohead protease
MARETRTTATAGRPDGPERRAIPSAAVRIERRAAGDATRPHIVGHASVFDQWTTLYEGRYFVWREVVRPGAYRNAIAERQDVRSLFNHDANFVLGRTLSNTLILSEDATGLLTDTDPPDTQTIRDLVLSPIERGDVSGMSFAFTVRRAAETKVTIVNGITVIDSGGERVTIREEDGKEIEERELLDLNLFDVSPVTYPAYEQTDVALRSLAEGRERQIQGRAGRRSARMRMRARRFEALITTGEL